MKKPKRPNNRDKRRGQHNQTTTNVQNSPAANRATVNSPPPTEYDRALKATPNKRPKSSRAEIIGIGLSFVVGLLLVGVGGLQWKVYSQQAKTMTADHRPWVTLDDKLEISQKLTFGENDVSVGVLGKLINGGKSIATNVMLTGGDLLVEPIIPERVMIKTSDFRKYISRALPGGCNEQVAREFTSIGGRLILPNMSSPWKPSADGMLKLPRNKIKTDSAGRTAVWFGACVVYQDDASDYHWTPMALIFIDTAGHDNFVPSKIVEGSFEIYAGGSDAH